MQCGQLALAADERRVEPADVAGQGRVDRDEAVGGHRLALALGLDRIDRLDGDRVADQPEGEGAEQDLARCRGLLEPGRRVDRVAGDEPWPPVGSPATTSPVAIPVRKRTAMPRPRASSVSSAASSVRMSAAARTARSASSSWTTGMPKTAITASPMNFSTVPPWCSMTRFMTAK